MSLKTDSLNEWRPEILGYIKEIYEFHDLDDPLEILRKLSAFSARATWIRNLVIRSKHPDYNRFRIDELDPFLVEIDRQFKIWSRYSAVVKDEWDMSKGQ